MKKSSVRGDAGVRRASADKAGKKGGQIRARTHRQSSPLMSPAPRAGRSGGGTEGIAGELASLPPIQRQLAANSLQSILGSRFVQRLVSLVTPPMQRQIEEEDIQTKRTLAAGSFTAGSASDSRLSATRGGGRPLPDSVRWEIEAGFGADFSGRECTRTARRRS